MVSPGGGRGSWDVLRLVFQGLLCPIGSGGQLGLYSEYLAVGTEQDACIRVEWTSYLGFEVLHLDYVPEVTQQAKFKCLPGLCALVRGLSEAL